MISWILGPESRFNTGIAKYSLELIDGMRKISEKSIKIISFKDNGRPNSILRYFWQFFILPLKVLFFERNNELIIYQEAFIFLVIFRLFSNKKTITVIHHVPEENDRSKKGVYLKFLFSILPKKNKNIVYITPSEFTKNKLIYQYGVSEINVHVVYNIIESADTEIAVGLNNNLNKLEKDFVDKIESYKRNGFTIVSNIGSFEDRKNVLILADVFNSLKLKSKKDNFLLVKVGFAIDENNKNRFISKCDENEINYAFLGDASSDLINYVYSASDIYIAPSRYEGFGRTVIEAQKRECLILASKIAAHLEILNNEVVFVDEINNPMEWAEKIITLDELQPIDREKNIALGVSNTIKFNSVNVTKEFLKIL